MKHFDTIKQLILVSSILLLCTISAQAADIIVLDDGTKILLNNPDLVCDNATDGGIIDGEQEGCANPTYDPTPLNNVVLPSGGTGTLEYIWISTTDNPHAETAIWNPIAGSTSDSYDPGPITEETSYRRCARRSGCTDYVAESNIITITIDCCDNVTDGGKIGYDQSVCGTSVDVDPIVNVV